MLSRFCAAVVLGCLIVLPLSAQTVRFDTNVGNFDLELNPTGNANLGGHVENILAYVEAGRYDLTVINRNNEVSTGGAADFVLQMGSFLLPDGLSLPNSFNDFLPIARFSTSVITDADNDGRVDFDTSSLTNSRGTVSLGLSGAGPNSGTSSFFINLDDIPSLDPGGAIGEFVPFAEVVDMTTVEFIRNLQTANLGSNNPNSSNIPVLANNRLVFIERAFVLEPTPAMAGPMAALMGTDGDTMGAASAAAMSSGGSAPSLQTFSVPEPQTFVLALMSAVLFAVGKPIRKGLPLA